MRTFGALVGAKSFDAVALFKIERGLKIQLKVLSLFNCFEFILIKYIDIMNSIFLMNFLGPEMLLVFFVILLLFGGKKIPELMRGLGRGVREFNDARDSVTKEFKQGMKESDKEKIKIEENTKTS